MLSRSRHKPSIPSSWDSALKLSWLGSRPTPSSLPEYRMTGTALDCSKLSVVYASTSMRIHTLAGVATTNLMGDYAGYGPVWYCENGIANVLAFSNVKKKFNVIYNDGGRDEFAVNGADGRRVWTFSPSESGLYYMDTNRKMTDGGANFMTTVEQNKNKYTDRDVKRAKIARKLQQIIGHPSARTYAKIVAEGRLKNYPVTYNDVSAAEHIWGPDLGSLKGKTVRQPSKQVRIEPVPIPVTIMEQYRYVTLGGDIMKVNKIPFLVTYSSELRFGTTQFLENMFMATVFASIKTVNGIYRRRGFRLTVMLMDGQFELLRGDLADIGVQLNITSRDEHVPNAERRIRTVKERTRCVYSMLKYKKIPARMIIEMVHYANFWLNVFPPADGGVSDTINPRQLITGEGIDYNKHCQLKFGEYVQVHEEHDNSMASRTTGAIALRPTGNSQGGYYFYSLTSGRVLNRKSWTALPIPADVINRVHELAGNNAAEKLVFTDRNNEPLDDEDYVPDEDEHDIELANEFVPVDDAELQALADDNSEGDDDPPDLIQEDTDSDSESGDESVDGDAGDENNNEGNGDVGEDADVDDPIPNLPDRERLRLEIDMNDAPGVIRSRTRSGMLHQISFQEA